MQPAKTDAASVRLELEGPMLHGIESWRGSQPKIPSRTEAVRLLLAQVLKLDNAAAA
jgi:hypothetical protein